MKKLLIFSIVLVTVTLAIHFAGAAEQREPLTVAIVFDTSPTGHWQELCTAAKNAYRSCHAGDTVLVFTVRGKITRLRFSSVKRQQDYEFGDFCSIVSSIKPDWLAQASIDSAISGPIYRKLLQRAMAKGRAIIAVITDGGLGSKQARDISKFIHNIKPAHNWSLLMTGKLEKTPKELLIESGKGNLYWCDLRDATDSTFVDKWMQQARLAATDNPETVTIPATSAVADSEVDHSKKGSLIVSELPSQSLQKSQQPKTSSKSDSNEIAKKVKPSSASLDTRTSKPAKSIYREATKGSILKPSKPTVDSPPLSSKDRSRAEKRPTVPSISSKPMVSRKERIKPILFTSRKTESEFKQEPKSSKDIEQPTFGEGVWSPLLVVTGVSITSVIAIALTVAWVNARAFQKKLHSPLRAAEQQHKEKPKALLVRVNGVLHRIGDLRRFRSFHMGAASNNAVRLDGEKVAARHARVFRRRGKLFIRNLAKTATAVNGKELRRYRKCLLTLPAALTIADGVKVHLFLEKQKNTTEISGIEE